MNIFVLDESPILAARDHCDKHICKMILESAQMLCAAHWIGVMPWRRTISRTSTTDWAICVVKGRLLDSASAITAAFAHSSLA